MRKSFFLLIFILLLTIKHLYAQKVCLGVRSSLLFSNQSYEMLVWKEQLINLNGMLIPVSFASSGEHHLRIGGGINTFIELYPYKSDYICFLLGVGYRQKGFTTQYINRLGGSTLNESSNNRFDYLSISLAERFYIKSYYITLGGYFDYLIGRKTHPELEYIYSNYKKEEFSPFLAFGKMVKINKATLHTDVEINPSFKNMLDFGNFFVGKYNSSIKNFVISLNVSHKF